MARSNPMTAARRGGRPEAPLMVDVVGDAAHYRCVRTMHRRCILTTSTTCAAAVSGLSPVNGRGECPHAKPSPTAGSCDHSAKTGSKPLRTLMPPQKVHQIVGPAMSSFRARPVRLLRRLLGCVQLFQNRPALRTNGSTPPIPSKRRNRLGNSAVGRPA